MKLTPPEKYRMTDHPVFATTASYGMNGGFLVPHYKISDYLFFCMVSDGKGWDHVSVSLLKATARRHKYDQVERCPTWGDMCFIKDIFFNEDETVIQYHPAQSDYVNVLDYCLHLWRPQGVEVPQPPLIMV